MTKIIGILNLTPDSFSDGGKFNSCENALNHLHKMLQDGADMIDIGAESTRPGASKINDVQEWGRLENILPEVVFEVKKFNQKNNKKVTTSIDSYHYETIKKAYEMGVDVINDVDGLTDQNIVEFIAQKNITTILMHNLPTTINADLIINPHIVQTREIIGWARAKISELSKQGVRRSQLIFDPGIGFNKNADQSIRILKNIDEYRVLELPIYIGHSKKSFLEKVDCGNLDRAQKTLLISKYLIAKKVEFIRVHDVKEHVELLCYNI